jgi:glutamine synthetase
MTTPKKNIIRKTSIEKNFITKLKKEKIEFLSFYFTDVLGKFHSITFTVEHLSQEDLEK